MFACSEAGQQEIDRGHREVRPRRPRRGLLLAEAPHLHVPGRGGSVRPEPVRVHPGQRPRAVLVGPHRRRGRRRPTRPSASSAPGSPGPGSPRRSSRSSSRRRRRRSSSAAAIAGLRAAIGLADIGLQVVLVERELTLGGWVGRFGDDVPARQERPRARRRLVAEVKRRPAITVLTGAEVVAQVRQLRQLRRRHPRRRPGRRGHPGPRRLDRRGHRLRRLPAGGRGARLRHRRRPHAARVQGAARRRAPARWRTTGGRSGASPTSTASAAASRPTGTGPTSTARATAARPPSTPRSRRRSLDATVRQFHLYRDMRTYGKYETLYTESRKAGSVYLRFPDDEPPAVAAGDDGRLVVTVRDLLTGGEELAIPADLVVLVTGMVPRKNEELVGVAQAAASAATASSTRSTPSCARWRPSSTASSSPAPARARRAPPRAWPPAWPP